MEQVLAVLDVAARHSERDRLMFAVTFNHGLRASETVGLAGANVTSDGKLDVQRLKGSKRTIQPFPPNVPALLEEKSLLLFAGKQERLFPIGRRHFAKLFKRYALAAGVPTRLAHPHILKHSCANFLLSSGVDIADVMTYLGHERLSSTQQYLKRGDDEASASAAHAFSKLA